MFKNSYLMDTQTQSLSNKNYASSKFSLYCTNQIKEDRKISKRYGFTATSTNNYKNKFKHKAIILQLHSLEERIYENVR